MKLFYIIPLCFAILFGVGLDFVYSNTLAPQDSEQNCTQEYNPVCGKLISYPCPDGTLCQFPLPKTYPNTCVMKASNAELEHEGVCLYDTYVSEQEKMRIDRILEAFFQKLESQEYSHSKISSLIEVLYMRLEEIHFSMPEKFPTVYYVGEKLKEYRDIYNNRSVQDKYYIGDTKKCMIIKYECDEGWDIFSDEKGCGCEKK